LSASAIAKLRTHSWRGNVRELDNCIQRAAILAMGEEVDDFAIRFDDVPAADRPLAAQNNLAMPALGGDLKARERELILDALRAVDGNRKKACERLGISGRTLRYKLAKFREQGVALPGEAA
jgi:two-component system response regulator FlrC